MAEQRDPLAYSTPVNKGALKKRSLAFMSGYHLACPVMYPGFWYLITSTGWDQLFWLGFTVVVSIAAIALHQWNPWFIDDYMTELKTPKYLTDIASDELTRLSRYMARVAASDPSWRRTALLFAYRLMDGQV
jgi:hypothetical protein